MHQEFTEAQPIHTLTCFLIQSKPADMVILSYIKGCSLFNDWLFRQVAYFIKPCLKFSFPFFIQEAKMCNCYQRYKGRFPYWKINYIQ